jgi:hypothetical protein
MQYADYIAGFSFRFVKPDRPIPASYHRLSSLLGRLNVSLEIVNTRVPEQGRMMKRRLHQLCRIPRMSTFAIAAMINRGVSELPDGEAFVNVGVWHGFTLLSAMIDNPEKVCIGVDNFTEFGGPRAAFTERFHHCKTESHFFYDMGYREYFTRFHKSPIGFYIYDGGHSYDDQIVGLQLAEPFFSENCIVLVDDTNWDAPRKATEEFMLRSSNKYAVLLDETTYCNKHPTFWNGVMVLRRIG